MGHSGSSSGSWCWSIVVVHGSVDVRDFSNGNSAFNKRNGGSNGRKGTGDDDGAHADIWKSGWNECVAMLGDHGSTGICSGTSIRMATYDFAEGLVQEVKKR